MSQNNILPEGFTWTWFACDFRPVSEFETHAAKMIQQLLKWLHQYFKGTMAAIILHSGRVARLANSRDHPSEAQ